MHNAALITALEAELAAYLRRGMTDRAEQVRHELRRIVGSVATTTETVPDGPASTPDDTPAKQPTKKAAPRSKKAAK